MYYIKISLIGNRENQWQVISTKWTDEWPLDYNVAHCIVTLKVERYRMFRLEL